MAVLIPLGFGTKLSAEKPILFGSVIVAFILSGILRWRALLVDPPPSEPEAAERWLQTYGYYTVTSGLIWGLFACYMEILYRGVFLQFTILLVSAGIGCFSLGAFAGEPKLSLRYLISAIGPPLVGVALGADGEAAVLLVLMGIYLIAVSYQVSEINNWFLRSTVESLLLEKARKEAEAAARVKSDFLANMSHELRTPMNGVMGMLELLLQSDLDRDQQLLARTGHRSAEALLEILNDILDFSKMSAGKLDFARKDFVVRYVIEDVLDLMGMRAFEKGLDIGYTLDSAIPDWLCGDEGRLRQVLLNLVSNAIKFSHGGQWPSGGSVGVAVKLESQRDHAVRLLFSVSDKGVGMSASTVAKLFRPFMQADTSTSRRYGGTGLGLAISRQLVEAMGGKITAESQQNVGTTFSFDITISRALNAHTSPVRVASCSVLVLEPAALSRRTIGELIERHGGSAVLTATIEEAMAEWSRGKFHCVLADVASGLRPESFPNPAPPLFWIHHRGETREPLSSATVSLARPVRSTQIADFLTTVCGSLVQQEPAAPVSVPLRLSGHVLIAEDNAVNQMLAQRLVGVLGLTAFVVPNGAAALEALATQRFRLVLMDCQMPGMDGYEATKRLREIPSTAEIPVIAMTANAMKGDRELCLAAGMTDYLSKPIRLDRLREVLARYLPAESSVPESESSK